MIENKCIWIKTGYEIFALHGANELKIEKLAKKVGISKSSFYHHFADLSLFIELLMEYHIQQAYIIADKESKAKNIEPELIYILIEHKMDLLFNRQLRINREQKRYMDTLESSNKIVGNNFIKIWAQDLNLKLSPQQLEGIFELALENFYLQISFKQLNYIWLSEYFKKLKRIAGSFSY